VFLSHEIGMRKPNTDTFEYVLDEAGINANETLFIEDSIQHIESANNVGIQTRLWESNKPLSGLFPYKAL
jgi:putative hydrolase of the HAD superfamily